MASVESLGLLAQRLFTVSTSFRSGHVLVVRSITNARGRYCPRDETWFEVVVDMVPGARAATTGGVVAPAGVWH